MIILPNGHEVNLDDPAVRERVDNYPCLSGRLRDVPFGINPGYGGVLFLLIPYRTRSEHNLLKQYMVMRGDVLIGSIAQWQGNSSRRVFIYQPELLQVAKDLLLSEEDEEYERPN